MNDWALRTSAAVPVLTDAQAVRFGRDEVLSLTGRAGALRAEPWVPDCHVAGVDFRVSPEGEYRTVQSAVEAAIRAARQGGPIDVCIGIAPGDYAGVVILPGVETDRGWVRYTIVGLGAQPQDTRLHAAIDAGMPGEEYAQRFDAGFLGACPETMQVHEARSACEALGTFNAAVVRNESDDLRLHNLTIINSYNLDRATVTIPGTPKNAAGQYVLGQHQAVAFHNAGADRAAVWAVHLRSLHDTLYLQAPSKDATVRSYFCACEIEGDVDYVFGQATAYFDRCTLRTVCTRVARSWVAAPATHVDVPYGFVFNDCAFTNKGFDAGQGLFCVGRQWFEGARATPYGVPNIAGYAVTLGEKNGFEPPVGRVSRSALFSVGKVVLLGCYMGAHINPSAPWDDWSGPGYDAGGAMLPGDWKPRYRPVQTGPDDFNRYRPFGITVPAAGALPWVGMYRCTFAGGV